MINRRAFIQGMMVTAAGLLVPEPARLIFDVGRNLSRPPEHKFISALFDWNNLVGMGISFEFGGEQYRHAVAVNRLEHRKGKWHLDADDMAQLKGLEKRLEQWKVEKFRKLLNA